MRKLSFSLSLTAFAFVACSSDEEQAPPIDFAEKYGAIQVAEEYDRSVDSLVSPTASVDLSEQAEGFALKLLNLASSDHSDENVLVSPLSATLALGMTMNGAEGETLDAMLAGLGFEGQSLKDVNSYLAHLSQSLTANEAVTLELANSIWLREDYSPLKRSFHEVVTQHYGAGLFPLAGSEPINGWVADATHGKITELLDALPGGTAMVLANALYFHGKWLTAFDKNSTQRRTFHSPSGEVQADMMHIHSGEIRFKKGLDYTAVAIPYRDEHTSLYVVVPEDEPLDAFSSRLLDGTSGGYYQWDWTENDFAWVDDANETLFSGFSQEEVTLALPKFTFEFKRDLEDDLTALGMGGIFSPETADFPNFAEGQAPWVYQVIQKTFIDVNEEGTEAAAATAVLVVGVAEKKSYELLVDRPFAFFLRDDATGAVLFAGQINEPAL